MPSKSIHVGAGDDETELPPQVVCGLFEVLSFEALLEDAGIATALEAALLQLAPSHELQLAQGGRYPGLYRLLAYPNSAIRSIVSQPSLLEAFVAALLISSSTDTILQSIPAVSTKRNHLTC